MNLTSHYIRIARESPQEDSQGGLIPSDPGRAQKVDLITLPEGIPGTNCGNCKFIKKGDGGSHCSHPKVQMPVNNRNCCALWDAHGVLRNFKL